MIKGLLVLVVVVVTSFGYCVAQKKNKDFQFPIKRATSSIIVDGLIDEDAWKNTFVANSFHMVLPMDTSLANVRTEVRLAYDDHHLYLLAVCYHGPIPGPYMVESLRRDWDFVRNDNFIMFMDTFDDQTNGFAFGSNAAGAQWDGIMYEGGKVDLSWDNKWVSVVKNYPDRWVLEASIPFKTIRYKKGVTTWGINFGRNDLKTTEKSAWAPVPRQFPTASLAYTGTLEWDQPPPQAGPNVSVIPYVLGGATRDFADGLNAKGKLNVGADAKIALTSSLNLDLTVRPDFSQVDVDKQVINLSRFELFFPEKRQFFLENGDLFANFGYATIRPFFSRRIGLGVPINYGARLSGKINKLWRIGIMDMKTQAVDSVALPGQNFMTFAVQRKVFSRSNIGIMFVNKQSLDYHPGNDPTIPVYSKYNRNLGLEYNLASSNNIWTGKLLVLKSFSPGKSGKDFVQAGHLQYFSRKWLILWQHEYIGANFSAETGYVPRVNYIKGNPQISRLFFPNGSVVLSHGPGASATYYFNPAFHRTDNESVFTYLITFRQRSTLAAVAINDYVKLLAPFDPLNVNKNFLPVGFESRWNSYGFDFVSKPQSVFVYSISVRNGGYYADGTRFNSAIELRYRIQPFVSLIVTTNYNRIRLPEPWGLTNFWLISPRLDVTMTNKLFFTAFMQYNQQLKNNSLNTRFQWRYKPASDIFVVYTDNYLTSPLTVKNRSLVVKWTYWWTL